MAHQVGKHRGGRTLGGPVTAKGDAPNTGAPGATPAPVKRYAQPDTRQRTFVPNYGTSGDPSMSSVEPGHTVTSPLADELQRVAALGDGGDHLQDVIERGTARDATADLGGSPQTRPYSLDQKVPTAAGGSMKRQTEQSAKPGDVVVGSLPAKLGASVTPDPSRTAYDKGNK